MLHPLGTPLSRRLLLAGASTLLATTTAGLAWRALTRGIYALPTESDRIVELVRLDGRPTNLLIAGLHDAMVVVPDRPHDPKDALDPVARSAMKRRRVFRVDTNDQRLRGPTEVDRLDRPRVLLLGDSVPFGWGVDWPACLPQRFSLALDAPVLAAGVPGMRPDQVRAWARHLLQRVEVDLVLVVQRPRQEELPALAQLFAELARRSAAPVALAMSPVSTFDVRGAASVGPLLPAAQAALPGLAILEATDALRPLLPRRGVQLRREHGRQQIVEVETGHVHFEAPDPGDRVDPAIHAALYADPALREAGFFDGGHVDEEGSELLAGVLADFVRRQGLWPPA